jgi:hypothetical protein
VEAKNRQFKVKITQWLPGKKEVFIPASNWNQKASYILYPGDWWKGEPFEVLYQEE